MPTHSIACSLGRSLPIVGSLIVVLVGCGIADLDSQDAALAFQGTFEPVSPEQMVEGDVAAVSQQGLTEVGLAIRGLAPETDHSWVIRANGCSEEGETLLETAVYPSFETDDEGEGSHGLVIQGMLVSTDRYAVEVHEGEVGLGVFVACGTLNPV